MKGGFNQLNKKNYGAGCLQFLSWTRRLKSKNHKQVALLELLLSNYPACSIADAKSNNYTKE